MKLKNFFITILMMFIFSSYLMAEVDYSTDFNSIDKDFFLVYDHGGYHQTPTTENYSLVSVDNGILKMPVNETDHGPELITKGLKIDKNSIVTVSWRAKVHYANKYFAGGVYFWFVDYSSFYNPIMGDSIRPFANYDNTTGKESLIGPLAVYYRYYYYGDYSPPVGGDSFGICGYKKCLTVDPVWDDWFTNKVEINFQEKTIKYWQNDTFVGEVPLSPDLDIDKYPYLKIHFSPYGWYTGHEMDLDWMKINISEANENSGSSTTTPTGECAKPATFDFFTMTLNVPCMKLDNSYYSLKLKITSSQPSIIMQLTGADQLNISCDSMDYCATFDFNTLILNVPHFTFDGKDYSLKLKIIQTQPNIIFQLIDIKEAENNSQPNNTNSTKKTVTLSTLKDFQIIFANDKLSDVFSNDYDLSLEPWCTDKPGLCGNFIDIGDVAVDSNITFPDSGYLSDKAGFDDCVEVDPNHTFINKNRDGTHTVFKIIKHEKPSECEHTITIEYITYPE